MKEAHDEKQPEKSTPKPKIRSELTETIPTDPEVSSFFDLRTAKGQILFFLITLIAACLIQFIPLDKLNDLKNIKKWNNQETTCNFTCPTVEPEVVEPARPTYWIFGNNPNGDHLRHVNLVLNRLSFERINENETDEWDLLWAHDYPFTKLRANLSVLKPHQRVNHFPGCGFITNKVDLSTTDLKYIPKAFKLPGDVEKFKEFAIKNPEKHFVVKHNQHRHIKIKKIDDIDLESKSTFIQEYISNPLLVDGHKFDIGVYTIITSIDPLRVYIYHGDILFRYCPTKYHPFDPDNVDKYIVGDDYTPTWEIPSLAKYYNSLGFGMKHSFDAYIQSQGYDSKKIWDQVEDAIRGAILNKEPFIKDILKRFRSKQNFFEMIRFDLIVDNDLQVFLMEANMSPNLSSAHFQPNKLLYEQVIYNLLNLVGVGAYIERESMRRKAQEVESMISSDKNVVVGASACSQAPCVTSCASSECRLCKPCMSKQDINELHNAFREHVNRGENKRIFPVPMTKSSTLEDELYLTLSPKNKFMTKWFYEKCQMNSAWCN